MSSTVIIILVVLGLLVFGGLGYFIFLDISLQRMEKKEKEANRNKKGNQ